MVGDVAARVAKMNGAKTCGVGAGVGVAQDARKENSNTTDAMRVRRERMGFINRYSGNIGARYQKYR